MVSDRQDGAATAAPSDKKTGENYFDESGEYLSDADIARRGIESSERLGRHRWVVERTHAWFAGFGKLRIRFERRLDIHTALLVLAAAVICSRFVDDLC